MESKKYLTILCTLIFSVSTTSVFSQSGDEFNKPWDNPESAIVIDAYHRNKIDWNELKKDKRVVGIIHKATEGKIVSDPKYSSRRLTGKAAGYKWGSYHLLRKGDPIGQAEFYLKTIGANNPDEIMALDVECTEDSQCGVEKYRVTADEIETFISYIKRKTGRSPVFYGNQSVVKALSKSGSNHRFLGKIPLWYARFKTRVTDFPKGIWKSYTFWQFSSEINCKNFEKCLYRVPGTLSDMDINIYNGTTEELRSRWASFGK